MAAQLLSITNGVPSAAIQLTLIPGCLQTYGTFAGGKFALEASHNNTNFSPLLIGDNISDIGVVSMECVLTMAPIAVGWWVRLVNKSQITTGFTATVAFE